MATKGSKTVASDEIFDFVCSPCSKKGRNNEAVKYCADCQEYLCVTCVEYHNNFSVLAGHTLLGRSQFGTTSKADSKNLPSLPTDRCRLHTMKLVDMYCVDHDAVGCHVCFTINHKPCQNIHYIPEYVQATDQTSNIKSTEDELKKAISTISMTLTQTQKTRDENSKSRASSLQTIKDFRAQINQTFDRLEQTTIAEIDENYNKLDSKFEEELKKMQETLHNLKKRLTAMETSRKNPSQLFVCSNVCNKTITEAEQNRTDTGNEQIGYRAFVGNPEVLSLLQKLTSLGEVRSRQSLYKILDQQSYCVKQKDDTTDCSIFALCILDSGDIMLADFNNDNIKLIDRKTHSVVSTLNMSSSPRSVCVVSDTEVAVSLEKTVQFVSIGNQLTPTRSLKFDHSCRGIAVMDDQLVLCKYGGKHVYIYTMNGKRVKTFSHDGSGNEIFGFTRDICFCCDCRLIHVTDHEKGIVTLDSDGNLIWRKSSQDLKDAWGVCTDADCNVFVSDKTLKKIVQIGSDGQYLGNVVPASSGLRGPTAVCFHEKSSTLTVADANQIHVFRIN